MAELVTVLVESLTEINSGISKNVPVAGNVAICADSLCTGGLISINFYCAPNPVAKVFFGASCICEVIETACLGIALIISFMVIPIAGWISSFSVGGFNRLGKYSLHMGNITNGNITHATDISDLMF